MLLIRKKNTTGSKKRFLPGKGRKNYSQIKNTNKKNFEITFCLRLLSYLYCLEFN